jgi:radical SAM protein with 4Fe4S-binding SPASM domain
MTELESFAAATEPYLRQSYAVWELTLKCNLACSHCGSRAGDARVDELSTDEAFDLVRQMAEVGITEVSIEGGEAFLRPDWLDIARAITDHGMRCSMATGGYGISRETVRRMKDAGIRAVSVSVDGMAAVHDRLRGRQGSWTHAQKTLGHLREVGIPFGCNTQINRLSAPDLPELYECLRDAGISVWQIQLTIPLGNAADAVEILLQPCELLDLYPMLARIARRAIAEGVTIQCGNNIGYNGPYEHIIRAGGKRSKTLWIGCQAGLATIGIHADGAIKACPTLPAWYVGGNIRETSLAAILETRKLAFNMDAGTDQGTDHLWGFCKQCEHGDICRGGCTANAHTLFGKSGNNPHCHHRTLELAKIGKRERVVPKLAAIGKPFDHAEWTLLEEPVETLWPAGDSLRFTAEQVRWPASYDAWPLAVD